MADDIAIRIAATAMQNSKAWPAVFKSGCAEELARAAFRALRDQGYQVLKQSLEPTTEAH